MGSQAVGRRLNKSKHVSTGRSSGAGEATLPACPALRRPRLPLVGAVVQRLVLLELLEPWSPAPELGGGGNVFRGFSMPGPGCGVGVGRTSRAGKTQAM